MPTVKSIKDVIAQFSYLRDKSRKHLAALYLNARNELFLKKYIFVGTLDANIYHLRTEQSSNLLTRYSLARLLLLGEVGKP